MVDRIIGDAIRTVYAREVDPSRLTPLLTAFDNGLAVDASDEAGSYTYIHQVSSVEGVSAIIDGLGAGKDPASIASAVEFLLEGLHRNRKLSKRITGEGVHYAR